MDRTLSTGLAAAAAVLALQACERPTADTFASSMRSASPRAPIAIPAAEAPAPPTQAPAKPIPSPESLSDTVITGRIKASLLTDPALAGSDVSVNTDHGVVNLTGTVRSHEQQAIASAHAQSQDGVMRIESHLAVLNP
jgi:hyperosmotically inducible protein